MDWTQIPTLHPKRIHYGFNMNGTTITLKNVPAKLHRALKDQAKKHKRSLNMEAIQCLEHAMTHAGEQRGTLRSPPPFAKVGMILKPLENRADRQDDLMERGS